MDNKFDGVMQELDAAKKISRRGGEYWMGRDIQKILGYSNWVNFKNVIDRARMACQIAGVDDENHFSDVSKKVMAGSGAMVPTNDCFLTRYACYLIAMNGDPSKPEIGAAQTYFAIQTRRQEMQDQLTEPERRIQLRRRVKEANKSLTDAAKNAGVQRYAIFHDAGYQGLYEMGLAEIKKKKGLALKDNLLDRAGRTELAANEFRITQAEEKLIRDKICTESGAIIAHRDVGREVRNVIKKIGGTMPEDLPTEEPIDKLITKTGKNRKAITDKS